MVKVLTVDDSVFMRTVIRDMLTKDPSIEVVGTASNGIDALEKIQSLNPDIVTLDIEMPKMNGLEVLRELQKVKRRPKILMLSSLTSKDAESTHEAIRLGADDFMLKPKDLPHVRDIGDELIAKVKHLFSLTHRRSWKGRSHWFIRRRTPDAGYASGSAVSRYPGRYHCHPAYAHRVYCGPCRTIQPYRAHAR